MLEVAQTVPAAEVGNTAERQFSFAIRRVGATVVVALHGELDELSVAGLTPVLRDLIDDQGNQSVVVDLEGVTSVDPSAARLFRDAWRWARTHRASFGLRRKARFGLSGLEVSEGDQVVPVVAG
jgi:anti-anti-sigma factor